MALTRVQSTGRVTANTTTYTLTFATPPALGSGLLLAAIHYGGALPPTAVTDNRGHTYTRVVQYQNGSSAAIFLCPAVTGTGAPFTLTVNQGGARDGCAVAMEISGGPLSVEAFTGATGTSTTPATGATAALTAAEVCLLAVHVINTTQGSITVEAVSPVWLQEFEDLSFARIPGEADSRLVTGALASTPSCSWTDTAASTWAAVIAAFSGGAAPAAVPTAQPFIWGPL
jgi:hypothetical protein